MDFMNGLNARMTIQGRTKVDRLHNRKRETMHMALENSDQAFNAEVTKLQLDLETHEEVEVTKQFRMLMNPTKLTQDIDLKMFSIDFEHGIEIGDIVKCIGDKELGEPDSEWLLLWRHYEESSYFRAEGKRCDIIIDLPNGEQIKGASRSPVETTTPYIIKQKNEWGEMNSSVFCMLPMVNEDILKFFDRGCKVKIGGNTYEPVARDILVTGKTFEVTLKEYYNDTVENREEEIKPIEKDPIEENLTPVINGDFNIHIYDTKEYSISNTSGGTWSVDLPNKVKILSQDGEKCKIEIVYNRMFSFYLIYSVGNETITQKISVKSL